MQELASISERNLAPILTLLVASWRGPTVTIKNKEREQCPLEMERVWVKRLKRAVERSKLDRKTNIELVENMWEQFSDLGIYEYNIIATTTVSIKDTVAAVKEKIVSG